MDVVYFSIIPTFEPSRYCKCWIVCFYYIFFVADQPYLKEKTIEDFLRAFVQTGKTIGCVKCGKEMGNPVIFHEKYKEELECLQGDKGGKCVLRKYEKEVFYFEVEDKKELQDIDERGELS